MSHIVEITTEVRDETAVAAACQQLGLAAPERKTVRLFNDTAVGLAVQLTGWHYPIVINTASGDVKYDNFEGRWGDRRQLSAFLQRYAVEKTRLEARRRGYRLSECPVKNGSIKLTIQLGGTA